MAAILPEPEADIEIIVDEESTDPFEYKRDDIRSWLAAHELEGDVLTGIGIENIKDFHQLSQWRPHPIMERQTGDDPPLRLLTVKLKLSRSPDWVVLSCRSDNFYVKGVTNQFGSYEITEPAPQVDGAAVAVEDHLPRLLPNFQALPWSVKYNLLFGCLPEELSQKFINVLQTPQFEVKAIKALSNCHLGVGNDEELKKYLAGLIFKLCEFVRMRLSLNTPYLREKIHTYGQICYALLNWRDRRYMKWDSKKLLSLKIDNYHGALYLIRLVLNKSVGHYDRVRIHNLSKKKSNKAGSKDSKFGHEHSGNKSGSSEDPLTKGGSSEEGSKYGSFVPCGNRCVQLLQVSVNFQIDALNIYDTQLGQMIYVRRKEADEDMKHLDLIGPAHSIGAYGALHTEVYPTHDTIEPTTKRMKTTADYSHCHVIRDRWFPFNYDEDDDDDDDSPWFPRNYDEDADDDDDRPTKHVHCTRGSLDRTLEISYLLIPNAIEASIKKMRLRFGEWGSNESYEVSGYIRAWTHDYGDDMVDLCRLRKFTFCSGTWTSIPLQVSTVCLPYRPDLRFSVGVDLTVTKLSASNESRKLIMYSDCKAGTGNSMGWDWRNEGIETEVKFYPDIEDRAV